MDHRQQEVCGRIWHQRAHLIQGQDEYQDIDNELEDQNEDQNDDLLEVSIPQADGKDEAATGSS